MVAESPKHIRNLWNLLQDGLGLVPGSVQAIEMERAFFCGAHGALTLMRVIGETPCSDEDGVQFLEDLWEEVETFRDGIK